MRIFQLTTLLALSLGTNAIPTLYPFNSTNSTNSTYLPPRLITLEEHMLSPSLEAEAIAAGIQNAGPNILEKLLDVGAGRLADMDTGHVNVQVLSQPDVGVGLEDPEGCREANDYLRAAIDAYPDRFAGFAVLPMAFPELAAAELERSVKGLGFKGAMLWNHLKNGTYYDSPAFHPVFATAQDLDVPLYLHPTTPAPDVAARLYAGNYFPATAALLGGSAWGWHVDVGLHVLRLYVAGVFDLFPRLKLIIGHNGEGLPIFVDRVGQQGLRNGTSFSEVWKRNIWCTTSGFFTVRQFRQLLQVSPVERVLYSVDYPFEETTDGWAFAEELAREGVLSRSEMDAFAYKNAEKLLKL
ncbi:hypothetical protein G6514_003001 [Epicoccum nigrum]|nr:hypothetical protein G6514_003001 [Epicoccum nigrum]